MHLPFSPTPLERNEHLSALLACNVYFKRDDLFTIAGGGSKARMLQYILYQALHRNAEYILTAGGPYSNFNRALALMCGMLNLKMKLVIYDKNEHIDKMSLNKRICDLCNVEYVYCSPDSVAQTIDEQKAKLEKEGKIVYYIWGGGKSPSGVQAYVDCVQEMAVQADFKPDHIFLPLGTGTTFTGISIGCSNVFPDCNVVGVSVARTHGVATNVILDIVAEWNNCFDTFSTIPTSKYRVEDNYLMGGYGHVSENLTLFLQSAISEYGLVLDEIYVGKALYGMVDMIKNDKSFRGKDIIFVNTGGIYNF